MLNKNLHGLTQKGFTLIEIMISVLMVALVLNFAVPALGAFVEKSNLRGAAEEVYSQIYYARSESLKQSLTMYMKFVDTSTGIWSFGISSTTGCTPTDALGGTAPCTISVGGTAVRKAIENAATNARFPNISMDLEVAGVAAANMELQFDQVRGTVNIGGLAQESKVILTSPRGWIIKNEINVLGHVKLCSPAGTGNVPGYPPC